MAGRFLTLRTRHLPLLSIRSYTTNALRQEPKSGDRVLVGMSGGVDSSVTAKLLAEKDYDLSAVFMRNWDTRDESASDTGCEWEKDWEDVQRVCKTLDIPCKMIDLSKEYWNRVFQPSLNQWEAGQTPNPDILCNREIKFGALLEHLPTFSSSSPTWFATGHYAQKSYTKPFSPRVRPRPRLLRPNDKSKDQTYFLAGISESSLHRSLFPLGEYHKSEVKELAKKWGLATAEKKESMGICFIGKKTKFGHFISSYIPPKPGPIIDLSTGSTIATHEGLWSLTIGQNAKIRGMPQRMFVVKKNAAQNTIYVAPGADNPYLFCHAVNISSFSWIWNDSPPQTLSTPSGLRALAKIRYRMEPVPCTVQIAQLATGTEAVESASQPLLVTFDAPESSIAPGQTIVLYDVTGEWTLGCGDISETIHAHNPEEIPSLKNRAILAHMHAGPENGPLLRKKSAYRPIDDVYPFT